WLLGGSARAVDGPLAETAGGTPRHSVATAPEVCDVAMAGGATLLGRGTPVTPHRNGVPLTVPHVSGMRKSPGGRFFADTVARSVRRNATGVSGQARRARPPHRRRGRVSAPPDPDR